MEGIGIALDVAGDRMFVTDLRRLGLFEPGSTDRNSATSIYAQGNLTGVAYAEI